MVRGSKFKLRAARSSALPRNPSRDPARTGCICAAQYVDDGTMQLALPECVLLHGENGGPPKCVPRSFPRPGRSSCASACCWWEEAERVANDFAAYFVGTGGNGLVGGGPGQGGKLRTAGMLTSDGVMSRYSFVCLRDT